MELDTTDPSDLPSGRDHPVFSCTNAFKCSKHFWRYSLQHALAKIGAANIDGADEVSHVLTNQRR